MANTATLTKAMLADLMKGNASISLVACPANGQVTLADLDFEGADQIFTVKDSFQITPADVTKTPLKIDQLDEIIDTMIEEGDYQMLGNIPSIASAVFDKFYNAGASITASGSGSSITGGIKGQDGTVYVGKAYTERKEVYFSVLVESASRKTSVAFARVLATVNPPQVDGTTNPAYLRFSGDILKNLKAGEGNFVVLKAYVPAS